MLIRLTFVNATKLSGSQWFPCSSLFFHQTKETLDQVLTQASRGFNLYFDVYSHLRTYIVTVTVLYTVTSVIFFLSLTHIYIWLRLLKWRFIWKVSGSQCKSSQNWSLKVRLQDVHDEMVSAFKR